MALTVQGAVTLALEQNPVLKAAWEDVETARADVLEAKSALSPSGSLNGFGTVGSGRTILSSSPGVMPSTIQMVGPSTFANVGLMNMMPLYTGGKLDARLRETAALADAAKETYGARALDLAFSVKSLYYQVLRGNALLDVSNVRLDFAGENLRLSEQLFSVGKIPKVDLLRSKEEHADALRMVTDAANSRDALMVDLRTTLGLKGESRLTLKDTMSEESPGLSKESSLETAANQRPEAIAASKAYEAAEESVRKASAGYLPQVYAIGMYGVDMPLGQDREPMFTAGLVAGLPLFDGGTRRSAVDAAKARQRKVAREREAVHLQIASEVEKAWLALETARQNLKTSLAVLDAAEENYRVNQLKFKLGKGIYLELLDALSALTRSRTNRVEALYASSIAKAQLDRAIGLR